MNQQYYLPASASCSLRKEFLAGGRDSPSPVYLNSSFPFFNTEHPALCPHQGGKKKKKGKQKANKIKQRTNEVRN